MKTTVSIVEDNLTYRESLLKIVQYTNSLQCLHAFNSGEACLKQLEADPTSHPDILLLDLNLPGKSGIKILPHIKQLSPTTDVIVLTQNSDFLVAIHALKNGASGYLLKGANVQEIRKTIQDVVNGATYIDTKLSRLVMKGLCDSHVPSHHTLTKREVEVLELLALGNGKKEVAQLMGLSYHTIVSYVRAIFEKLESPNVASAIAKAVRQNII
jgi:DNA-binding NarL/FixJ family response regulator